MSAPAPPVRVALRPVGSPLPLGFLGLVVATVSVSSLQLGWVPPEQGSVVALGILAFTVPVQLLASTFGFLARDPVAGTGMGVLAGTWGAVGLVTLRSEPGSVAPGLGVLLVASAAAMLVPTAAASGKLVAAAVMGLSSLRFALTGIVQLTGSAAWTTVAGWTGVLLAALALYAALGFELEDVRQRAGLPLGRRGSATGPTGTEPSELAHEAGVRRQL